MEQATTPAAYLPDELVVEILAQLPAKSLCRFKCVSQRWRRLISNPAHRARLPQTLSGFFYVADDGPDWRFTTFSDDGRPSLRFAALPSSVTPLEKDGDGAGGTPLVDAALSFLPRSCGPLIEMKDSCNGLLLLRCSNDLSSSRPPPFYVVCNPATREWVTLPQASYTGEEMCTWTDAAIGFDPAVSSDFYVSQVVEVDDDRARHPIEAVEIYSSETGTWLVRECEPDWIEFYGRMTYFNGSLHLPIHDNEQVVSVDPKDQTWKLT
jgi:hypothetical protein